MDIPYHKLPKAVYEAYRAIESASDFDQHPQNYGLLTQQHLIELHQMLTTARNRLEEEMYRYE